MTRRTLREKLRDWSWRFVPVYAALWLARLRALLPPRERAATPWGQGIAVLIPERGTPDLLAATLAHARAALAQVAEPTEIVVMVNGADAALYTALQQQFPEVLWLFAAAPLGFNGAVEAGLRRVRQPCVYLLNSDMRIAPDALAQLLPYRGPGIFALASQIFFADPARRREETGWSDFYVEGLRTITYERDPGDTDIARGTLYAGGGSSLFRTELLREYVRGSRGYAPFYWEDADWGARAWAEGLECVFVPASVAVHEHRGTIKKLYAAEEIDRIVARNALQFELRQHLTTLGGLRALGHLSTQPPQTQRELCGLGVAAGIARMRGQNDAAKRRGLRYESIVQRCYAPLRPELPTIVWVTPFSVFPPAHGGARRIAELARRLQPFLNLILLSDEQQAYTACTPGDLAVFQSAHLLQARNDKAGQALASLPERMRSHAPRGLRHKLRKLQQEYGIDLVQIEFMEASRLVEERLPGIPFVLSLHDVYLDGGADDAVQRAILQRYDSVLTCSEEDAQWLAGLPHQVVANGATDRCGQMPPSPDSKRILFMGPFRYAPNHAGILQFLEQAWPAVRARHASAELVILAGSEAARPHYAHPLLQQPGVQVIAGFVDPVPYLADCALTINPQQEIRGSALKVAESLLARRVCVTTRNGARGFVALDTPALRVVDDWQAMADAINGLLADTAARHQAEQSATKVRSQLSWDGRAAELLQVYRTLLGDKFREQLHA